MAEVIRREPATRASRGRPGKHTWELWFSKIRQDPTQAVVCTRGIDFEVPLENFRVQALAAAKRRDLTLATRVDSEAQTVTFQIISKEPK